ncbi:hypothetical protein P343_02695 [Sporolactobacillus laevolacticus DSM 442]|uniref:Uncharacterized protein n=1 Tax=Sporolactobacillus laevolacticus DSM 442 TaxID=1395513 RepID=V6J0A1_9BACL|nr:hypothetical protein P343_02695 [Sporolactobacillus laevolacticus DSM 442]
MFEKEDKKCRAKKQVDTELPHDAVTSALCKERTSQDAVAFRVVTQDVLPQDVVTSTLLTGRERT